MFFLYIKRHNTILAMSALVNNHSLKKKKKKENSLKHTNTKTKTQKKKAMSLKRWTHKVAMSQICRTLFYVISHVSCFVYRVPCHNTQMAMLLFVSKKKILSKIHSRKKKHKTTRWHKKKKVKKKHNTKLYISRHISQFVHQKLQACKIGYKLKLHALSSNHDLNKNTKLNIDYTLP